VRAAWIALAVLVATATSRADAAPRQITVGTYINSVSSIDIKNNQFTVDFYIWFRWTGPDDIKPQDSFDLVNGRITSKSGLSKHTYGPQNYVSVRVLATITKFWDMARFPLDDHTLEISIEDSDQDAREAVFVADTDNAGISPELRLPGWVVTQFTSAVTSHGYATNYGDVTVPTGNQSYWSRYAFTIHVERPGYGRFLRVFFGLFISVLIAFTSFHVRPKESSPRVSLGVGATFAASAITVAINNALPDTNAVTMADELIMLTLGAIVATVAETIVALTLFHRGKEALQQKIDRASAVVFPLVYVALLIFIVV
jgi:hypothetical protein